MLASSFDFILIIVDIYVLNNCGWSMSRALMYFFLQE